MTTLKLNQLKLGSILSENINDVTGRLLLDAGEQITEKNLSILKAWGITEVSIVGDEQDECPIDIELESIHPQFRQSIDQHIDTYFSHCDKDHPALQELIKYVKIKVAKAQLGQ